MQYRGRIIRPPSEADSILLQATYGCSHNKCAFCGAYKDKRFGVKTDLELDNDLAFARMYCRNQRRVFLCDGDALILPQARLRRLLRAIREQLPWVTRVATYANAKSVERKNDDELVELAGLGLGMAYLGLESGDDSTLSRMRKGRTRKQIVAQAQRLRTAGVKLNVTVIMGLGGEDRAEVHAKETGRALSEMDPEQAAALSLMLVPGTPLHQEAEAGRFHMPGPAGMLAELRTMLQNMELTRGLFLANHASNYLPLKLRLPRDKASALARIDSALRGMEPLTPEWRRRL